MIIMAGITSFGDIHLCIIVVYCLYTVSGQSEVLVYIQDNVLLPCIYYSPVTSKVTIRWRDKDDKTVLDIEDSVPNLKSQSLKFQGRVQSFPMLYAKGNFSILLKGVEQADAGNYECHILTPDGPQRKIKLTVDGFRANDPSEPETGTSAGTLTSVQLLLLLAAPLACLLLSV